RFLCQKYAKDLPSFTLYSDITNKSAIDSSEYPCVIVQIDSLKRIRGEYDLIIFDELTYSLDHLVSSAQNKKRCFDVFKQIMYTFIENFKKSIENGENVKIFIVIKVQVLAYSPSIVAGISYEKEHFDKVYGIFCNTSATSNMALQQLFRVRNISTNEIHICCEITGKKDYPEDSENIKKIIIFIKPTRLNYEEKKYDTDDNTIRLGRNRKYEKIALCDHMIKISLRNIY
ncbi:hypothetical protein BY458DRAFT_495464, partial [Sporodiniella umbellata]